MSGAGMRGVLLASMITIATVVLIIIGTAFPNEAARSLAEASPHFLDSSSTPEGAVRDLVQEIGRHDWTRAYSDLANHNEFSQADFVRDITGSQMSLRTYATLANYDIHPQHASDDQAQVRAILHWSTVVGVFQDVRDLQVVHTAGRWQVRWPLVKEPVVPPQVIPVNYLRWDVIYRGAQDDWGMQDVEAPHVRIVDVHPVEHAGGVVVMGEILNEDTVPAFVGVRGSLLRKDGSTIATENAFDKISHTILPKQVTPFRIDFPHASLSEVDSLHMEPSSSLIAASADPIIGIEGQTLNPLPNPSLTGNLVNQSGQVVNIAHVLGTFYDNKGQLVWVADEYVNRALLPQSPEAFSIAIPSDIAGQVSTYRATTTTYSASRL
jgi:hypothetical protein